MRQYTGRETVHRNDQGQLHNEHGPAIINSIIKEWYIQGMRHRIDGPAVIRVNGTNEWWQFGKQHRTDGPAIVWGNEFDQFLATDFNLARWYVRGKRMFSNEQFSKAAKVSKEDMFALVLKYGGF